MESKQIWKRPTFPSSARRNTFPVCACARACACASARVRVCSSNREGCMYKAYYKLPFSLKSINVVDRMDTRVPPKSKPKRLQTMVNIRSFKTKRPIHELISSSMVYQDVQNVGLHNVVTLLSGSQVVLVCKHCVCVRTPFLSQNKRFGRVT
eukprot:6481889-Amphidinium_carterae.1